MMREAAGAATLTVLEQHEIFCATAWCKPATASCS